MEKLSDNLIKVFLETTRVHEEVVCQLPSVNRASIQIAQIDGTCNICGPSRPFKNTTNVDPVAEALISRGPRTKQNTMSTGHTNFEFQCLTCKKESLLISVHHRVQEGTITLLKYGEFPRKPLARHVQLEKFFAEDSEYYEKAVVCLAQGYGIGAFCYFRRIVEKNIYRLLDLLKNELEVTDDNSVLLQNLEMLKDNTPMSNKIEIANHALPEYLVPSGLNPLGRLYGTLSEGVHSLTDEECLEKSVSIEACLEFLISELSSRKKNRDSFASRVGKL